MSPVTYLGYITLLILLKKTGSNGLPMVQHKKRIKSDSVNLSSFLQKYAKFTPQFMQALYSKVNMPKYLRLSEIGNMYREKKKSYFHSSFDELHESESFERFLLPYENALSDLDEISWLFLKDEAEKLCISRDKNNRWRELFDKLNEAKGYIFLKSIGYQKISFIPRAKKNGIETPDLKGIRNGSTALCEVKTKNISDAFIDATSNSSVIRTNERLAEKLKPILEKVFRKAESQLNSIEPLSQCEKYIYLVITHDNEEVDPVFLKKLNVKIQQLFKSMNTNNLKLVIHGEGY
ncbi:MAG: hypothetical protein ACI80S_000419 [Pseudohongiellaceae bacterium]|jgi:hypothetical protein